MPIPFIPSEFWTVWGYKLYFHGLFAFIGLILGFIIILGTARKQKIHPKIMFIEAFWVLLGAWIGSKLLYYLGPYTSGNCLGAGISNAIGRGFVFYGGLLGAIIAAYAYTTIKNYDFWKHADFWALGAPLGLFFARIGCFLTNDAFGKITQVPWAIQLPDGTTRHPAALYLSFFNLMLFAYLYSRKSEKRFFGHVFLQYLMIYAAGRFIIEFFREYSFLFLGLTFSQWISVIVFVPAAIIYLRKSRGTF